MDLATCTDPNLASRMHPLDCATESATVDAREFQHVPVSSFCVICTKVLEFLAQPLWVGNGDVKLVSSFVKFKPACFRSLCRFCQKSSHLGRVHPLETAGGIEGLLKDGERIAASDDDAGRKIQRLVQTLDRGNSPAPENDLVAHRFPAENSDSVFSQNW
jgi:hypothetical protein